MDWNYPEDYVNISMPNSFIKALKRFQHPVPTRPQLPPHKWLAHTYGAKVQYSPDATTTPKLEKRGITHVQSITGTFLYFSCAVVPTVLVGLKKLGSNQASSNTNTI